MKLFRIITALSLITLATTVSASENQRQVDKSSDVTDVFMSASNDTSLKMKDYSDQFLVKYQNSLLNDKSSFEDGSESNLKFITKNRHETHDEVGGNNLSHLFRDNNSEQEHSLIEVEDHFNQGHELHEDHFGHGDDGHISLPVPEPSSYALLLAGLIMLGVVKLRKS